jgi:hypothetical protein
MTKKPKKFDTAPGQLSLLSMLVEEREERQVAVRGQLCVSSRLMAAVKEALKKAPKSRETIADEMSHATGQEITVHMVNSWVSDSHPHRLPAEFLPALVVACGCTEPMRLLAEAAGLFALQAPAALRAEIQQYDEIEASARAEKRRRKLLLEALEQSRV